MKKWSEIRQAIINKLFMDEQEVNNDTDNYASKFAYFANECLNQIANSVKPNVAIFRPHVYNSQVIGSDFKLEPAVITYMDGEPQSVVPEYKTVYIDVDKNINYEFVGNKLHEIVEIPEDYNEIRGTDFVYLPFRITYDEMWSIPNNYTIYNDGNKKLMYKGSELVETPNAYVLSDVIEMPEDFLSFADMINYHNGQPDPTITYVGDRYIKLPEVGAYNIFYNGLYEVITEDYMNDNEQVDLPIDPSILNCIPSYVASQILAEDDIQRSTILKNEYELMISRLDTNVMYETNHFKSNGGWY